MSDSGSPWLDPDRQRVWLAFMRVQLRMSYEVNRQLQTDSDLSVSDYDVLNALSQAPGHRLQLSSLAALIGWERSRLSHHLLRMSRRGLVVRTPSPSDGRATDAVLTATGQEVLAAAAPGHVELVRRLFFAGLPAALLEPLGDALEAVYAGIIANGTLPPPVL